MFTHSKYISFIFRGLIKGKYIIFHSENCNANTLHDQFEEAISIQKRIETFAPCNFNQTKTSEEIVKNQSKESNSLLPEKLSKKAKELYNAVDNRSHEMKNDETNFIEQCCFGHLQYNLISR